MATLRTRELDNLEKGGREKRGRERRERGKEGERRRVKAHTCT